MDGEEGDEGEEVDGGNFISGARVRARLLE